MHIYSPSSSVTTLSMTKCHSLTYLCCISNRWSLFILVVPNVSMSPFLDHITLWKPMLLAKQGKVACWPTLIVTFSTFLSVDESVWIWSFTTELSSILNSSLRKNECDGCLWWRCLFDLWFKLLRELEYTLFLSWSLIDDSCCFVTLFYDGNIYKIFKDIKVE